MSARDEEIVRLRRQGATLQAIASEFDMTRERVRQIVQRDAPEFAQARKAEIAHRRALASRCTECGAQKSQRARDVGRCRACANKAVGDSRRVWTRESLIAAIHDFTARYGNPPSAYHWNPGMASRMGKKDIAARFYLDGCWPATSSVQQVFGSWNAGISAAGFTPRRPSERDTEHGPNGTRTKTKERR